MSNKQSRDRKEVDNLFKDPKYCRQAWRSIGIAILQSPVTRMPTDYDKDGNPTLRSSLEDYSYNSLKRDIATLCKQGGTDSREPTELEMIMQCQIAKARFDTNAAIFVRDTLGAKPVDESKVDATLSNPYESLTDEELALLAEHRKQTDLPPSGQADGRLDAPADTVQLPEPSQHIVDEGLEGQAPHDPTRLVENAGDPHETSVYRAKQWIKRREWEETRDTSNVEQVLNTATDTPPVSATSEHIVNREEDER